MLTGTVYIEAIVRIPVENITAPGTEEDALIAAALLQTALPEGVCEIARYEVTTRRPDGSTETTLYHDRDFLDSLHQERLEEARIFTLDEGSQTVHTPAVDRLNLTPNIHISNAINDLRTI
jgi:hypothetical protein